MSRKSDVNELIRKADKAKKGNKPPVSALVNGGAPVSNILPVTQLVNRSKIDPVTPLHRVVPVDKDITYRMMRPSEMHANIADINNPGRGYQRPPKHRAKKLRAIAKKFDPRLLGMFHAWINEKGHFEVLDGLGRIYMLLNLLAKPYNEPVHVAIHHHIKTEAQAAEIFCLLNADEVTRVSRKHKFLSRLTAGDPLAIEVHREAKKGSLKIGGGGKDGISTQAAEALHQMDLLAEVGVTKINGQWDDKLPNPYFVALGAYIYATNDNSVLLRDTLRKYSPQMVEKEMHAIYGSTTPHPRVIAPRFARALLSLRNKGRSVGRVKAYWTRVNDILSEAPHSDRWAAIAEPA